VFRKHILSHDDRRALLVCGGWALLASNFERCEIVRDPRVVAEVFSEVVVGEALRNGMVPSEDLSRTHGIPSKVVHEALQRIAADHGDKVVVGRDGSVYSVEAATHALYELSLSESRYEEEATRIVEDPNRTCVLLLSALNELVENGLVEI
ncbi:MAG: hypothetical protein ACTSVT_04555, partial [Candidatus Thorarchaeota archaeon]